MTCVVERSYLFLHFWDLAPGISDVVRFLGIIFPLRANDVQLPTVFKVNIEMTREHPAVTCLWTQKVRSRETPSGAALGAPSHTSAR